MCAWFSQWINDLLVLCECEQGERVCMDKKEGGRSLWHGMEKGEAAHGALIPRTGGCLACPVS